MTQDMTQDTIDGYWNKEWNRNQPARSRNGRRIRVLTGFIAHACGRLIDLEAEHVDYLLQLSVRMLSGAVRSMAAEGK